VGEFAGTATFVDMTARPAHRDGMDGDGMDDVDVATDVFSPESEARVCEQVLGAARHGLQGLIVPR
jgi:hypothetical protein